MFSRFFVALNSQISVKFKEFQTKMSGRQVKKLQVKNGELLTSNPENGNLINQTIVQILVERDNPDEIKDLMRAELDFNRERLSIIREHAEKHPDAIEDRKVKKFRRVQYNFLMIFALGLLGAMFFVPTAIALILGAIEGLILAGIVVNGRDRDNDSEVLAKVIEKFGRDS